ncbi:MAG TPA: adenine phosphoribosyltransferase [bacterium]|mgnify:CR=1 FL=1|nr:adenine phosphoribosyltransferase [bacterium]
MDLKEKIRTIPDFPAEGIMFRDITTLLQDADALKETVDSLYEQFKDKEVSKVVGIESRGFIFGVPLALRLGCGFVPVRKPGKLPAEVEKVEYALEYGSDCVEIHKDALMPGEKVLVVDDLLATGGTAEATLKLVGKLGADVLGFAFIIELDALKGRSRLGDKKVFTIVHF